MAVRGCLVYMKEMRVVSAANMTMWLRSWKPPLLTMATWPSIPMSLALVPTFLACLSTPSIAFASVILRLGRGRDDEADVSVAAGIGTAARRGRITGVRCALHPGVSRHGRERERH